LFFSSDNPDDGCSIELLFSRQDPKKFVSWNILTFLRTNSIFFFNKFKLRAFGLLSLSLSHVPFLFLKLWLGKKNRDL